MRTPLPKHIAVLCSRMSNLALKVEEYKARILSAYTLAQQDLSKCDEDILKIEGMTGKRTRHFYNNLLDMPDARYLEVGVWQGSSFCSSLYKNSIQWAFGVDNWSQYEGPREKFLENLKKFKGDTPVTFIESDFKNIDVSKLPKFNVYLYDGHHDFDEHFKGLNNMLPALDDVFIYIVDDWNWPQVRGGTKLAIEYSSLQIMYCLEVFMTMDNSHTIGEACGGEYWNGLCVFVLQKRNSLPHKVKAAIETTTRFLPL